MICVKQYLVSFIWLGRALRALFIRAQSALMIVLILNDRASYAHEILRKWVLGRVTLGGCQLRPICHGKRGTLIVPRSDIYVSLLRNS